MSDSVAITKGRTRYTATVGAETTPASPVTVTGDKYTVTFAGNNFATKHLRRIRRASVSELTNPDLSKDKLVSYVNEAKEKSVERWGGKEASTNSLVYLDLKQFCQFGCQIIKFLKEDARNAWQPYPPPPQVPASMQKHVTVTIGRCLASSISGIGFSRKAGASHVDVGVGITMTVTVRQVNGSKTTVGSCRGVGGNLRWRNLRVS